MFTVGALKPPQPDATPSVKLTGVVVAVPPDVGDIVNQLGAAKLVVLTVKGVPESVADLTASVCADTVLYVTEPMPTAGVRVQINVIAVGATVNGEVVPTVTTAVTPTVISAPAPVVN